MYKHLSSFPNRQWEILVFWNLVSKTFTPHSIFNPHILIFHTHFSLYPFSLFSISLLPTFAWPYMATLTHLTNPMLVSPIPCTLIIHPTNLYLISIIPHVHAWSSTHACESCKHGHLPYPFLLLSNLPSSHTHRARQSYPSPRPTSPPSIQPTHPFLSAPCKPTSFATHLSSCMHDHLSFLFLSLPVFILPISPPHFFPYARSSSLLCTSYSSCPFSSSILPTASSQHPYYAHNFIFPTVFTISFNHSWSTFSIPIHVTILFNARQSTYLTIVLLIFILYSTPHLTSSFFLKCWTWSSLQIDEW